VLWIRVDADQFRWFDIDSSFFSHLTHDRRAATRSSSVIVSYVG
jgi:hypothetical protein